MTTVPDTTAPDLGVPVAFTPPAFPTPAPAEGRYARIEPLDPVRHGAALWRAIQGPEAHAVWNYLPYGPFADERTFNDWLTAHAPQTDPQFYALCDLDRAGGAPQGVASYLRVTPAHGTIEIGHVWLAPALQRTRAASEALFLLMDRALTALRYRRLEWKCNALNGASKRAAERYGFTYEGTFRQHMVVKGRNRDTAWYAITDAEWPPIRAAIQAWLDPANFDETGRQKTPLRYG